MKNHDLYQLNFTKLLHYAKPPVGEAPTYPRECTGFCVSCEEKSLLEEGGLRLDQMSHGASTHDFEEAICPLPSGGNSTSVAFLLESPGGYYNNGREVIYKNIKKKPPTNGFYWVPKNESKNWPTKPSEANPKSYSLYLAYLIHKHHLHNAYITNNIKCSLAERDRDRFKRYYVVKNPHTRDSKIRANCYEEFLIHEMRATNPRIVFCFGNKALKMATHAGLRTELQAAHFVQLYHPAARKSAETIINWNDSEINKYLDKVK